MEKKAPPITYGGKLEAKMDKIDDFVAKLFEGMIKLEQRLDRLEKGQGDPIRRLWPEKEKTQVECVLEALRYARHRFKQHSDSGIHKCLTPNEWKMVENEIKETEEFWVFNKE